MQRYEYRVVPAPARGEKARGVKSPDDRFAHALARAMNEMAAEGWEYQRAETLPCTESRGFFSSGTTTVYRSMLVFRRALPEAAADAGVAEAPAALAPSAGAPPPRVAAPAAVAAPAPMPGPAPAQEPQEPDVQRRLMAAFARPEATTEPPAPRPAGPGPVAPSPVASGPVLRADRDEPARGSRRLNLAAPVNGGSEGRAAVFRLPQGGRNATLDSGVPPRSVPRGD